MRIPTKGPTLLRWTGPSNGFSEYGNRNAIYKNLFDARRKLRASMDAARWLSHPTRSAALRAGTTRPPAEMTALRRQRPGITTAVLAGDSTRALLDAMPAAVAQACRSVGQG